MREHRFPQHDLERLDLARRGELLLGAEDVEHRHVLEVHRQVRAVVGPARFGFGDFDVLGFDAVFLVTILFGFPVLLGPLRADARDAVFAVGLGRKRRDLGC